MIIFDSRDKLIDIQTQFQSMIVPWRAADSWLLLPFINIKGSSRRAEKSHKVLMMMKAAKLRWARAGAGLG